MGFIKFTQIIADFYIDLARRLERDIYSINQKLTSSDETDFVNLNRFNHKSEVLEGVKRVIEGNDDEYDGFLILMYKLIYGRGTAPDEFTIFREDPSHPLYAICQDRKVKVLKSLRSYATGEVKDLFDSVRASNGAYYASSHNLTMQDIVKD